MFAQLERQLVTHSGFEPVTMHIGSGAAIHCAKRPLVVNHEIYYKYKAMSWKSSSWNIFLERAFSVSNF